MFLCKLLRSSLLFSFGLLLVALVMLAMSETSVFGFVSLQAVLFVVFGAIVVLLLALLVTLWPGSGQRLTGCGG